MIKSDSGRNDEMKKLTEDLKRKKKFGLCAGFFDPARPGQLTLGLNSARPGLESGRFGPYVLEPGPSRAKKSPSRIGPAREQH